jgi:hypothetical protein
MKQVYILTLFLEACIDCLVVGVKVRHHFYPDLTGSQNLSGQSCLPALRKATPIIFTISRHAILQIRKSRKQHF